METKLSFQDYRSRISIIDVAKSIGYSDRTQWAREKKSSANPCLQNSNGDQIIISQPGNLSKQLYFNPQDTSDKGDLITFVKNKLNLDTKGINEYLRGFLNGQPLIQNTRPQWNGTANTESPSNEFKAFYFKFSSLDQTGLQYLYGRGINAETLNSNVFQGFFQSVQLPVFRNGKFVAHTEETYLSVAYREKLNGEITGVDYRNASIHKHGVSSKKSTSVGFTNIPAVVKNIYIAESGIDAISHYQFTQPGDEVVYIITGGNLTLGQLKAIESIRLELSKSNTVRTSLLFDNDVAGSMYDLKFIADAINIRHDADFINIEHNKDSVTIEIEEKPYLLHCAKTLLTKSVDTNYQISYETGKLKVTVQKTFEEMRNVSNILLLAFSLDEEISIHKSPVQNDWNDAIKTGIVQEINREPIIGKELAEFLNETKQEQFDTFNNQAAKPEIFSQSKNKTMSQTNAGEQTQKTASEKMEGIMKSLGLKDVWDQLSKTFQSWADGPEEGRKSFVVENKTFRRTGFSDPSKNISTDMVVDISLNFNKNDKGIFFNSYTAELKNSIINGIKPEKRGSVKDTFEISLKKEESSNNLTIKKALNLLDGRSVCIGENNWIKRNGSDVVEYKFDLAKAIKDNKHVDFSTTSAEHMDSALESLKKGDYALISCTIDEKPVHIFLTADAQYKKVEAHDNTLYRHLSEAEKNQIQQNLSHKQDQVQGAKQHP